MDLPHIYDHGIVIRGFFRPPVHGPTSDLPMHISRSEDVTPHRHRTAIHSDEVDSTRPDDCSLAPDPTIIELVRALARENARLDMNAVGDPNCLAVPRSMPVTPQRCSRTAPLKIKWSSVGST